MARKTPWADGCCGPMFMVRRSLPPYPSSTTFLASGSLMDLAHGGKRRGEEDDGLHVGQAGDGLPEEVLPGRLLGEARTGVRALLEIAEGPDVHDLVELGDVRLPEPHAVHELLARGHHRLEMVEPFLGPAHVSAIPAELVHPPRVRRGIEREHRRHDLVLLRQQQGPDLRHVLLVPRLVLGEEAAEPLALVEVGEAPEVHELLEGAELGVPEAFLLAEPVAADLAADLARELEVLRLR